MSNMWISIVAASLVGLVMGFWTGAYLMRLRHSGKSWDQKFTRGSVAIAGMGGLPSAVFFTMIEEQAVWCVLGYAIALLVPSLIAYTESF